MEEWHDERKYIQQHLANERTYLAWVRTSIAIMGLGFLSAGFASQSDSVSRSIHLMIIAGGIGAVLMGVCILAFATHDFFMKRKGINREFFESPVKLIWFVSVSLGLISLILVASIIMMLL